jgi:hypothetical protein
MRQIFVDKIIKKIKFIHIFWTLFYLLFLIVLINNGNSYLDPDFGWHLKVGQEISTTYQVPEINTYNYTYTGNWVDHEWLSNTILYQIYSNNGYNTVIIFFAALIVFTLILLNVFIYQQNRSGFFIIAFFQTIGVIASMPHLGVRIQEVALLFSLILIIIINHYNKTKNLKVLIAIPIIIFTWANLHASFLIGFFILFSWVAIKLFENIPVVKNITWLNFSELIKPKEIYPFIIASVTALAATCLTPYGLKLYSFLAGYNNRAYLSLIEEWLPQSALPLNLFQLFYLALGTIAICFYIYNCYQNKEKINIWKIFLPIVFLILSFKSKRHFPLFFITSFELITYVYQLFFEQIKLAYTKPLKALLILCLLLVLALQIIKIKPINNPFTDFCDSYPCGGINFLKTNPQYKNANIFNEYSWGGFLIWAIPEKKIFIDGRLPQVEFSKWTFVEEYYDFITNKNNVSNKLKEYNIKLVLVKSRPENYQIKWWEKLFLPIHNESNSRNQLTENIDKSPDWKIIYQDAVSKIYFNNH